MTYNNNNNDDDKIEISVAYGNYWQSENKKNNYNANVNHTLIIPLITSKTIFGNNLKAMSNDTT